MAARRTPTNKPEPAKTTDVVVDPSYDFEKYEVKPGDEPVVEDVTEEDFDDLIEIEDLVAPSEPEPEYVNVDEPEVVPSAAELRIIELERQLAELEHDRRNEVAAPVDPVGHPVPEAELTPEQKRVRDLEDMVARQAAENLVKLKPQYAPPVEEEDGEDIIHFHVLNDGFTAFGKVWYQGQEIKMSRNSPEYKSTFNTLGVSWVDLYDNPRGQYERWGELKIGPGEWYGSAFNDRVAAEDQARGYSVPVARF